MIETERLVLRQFRESDAEDVLEYLATPAVHCFYDMKLNSLEEAKEEMKKRAEDDLYLAIALKESGKVIGEIFAHPEGPDPEGEVMDTFSPCWMLNLNYTGKGYAYISTSPGLERRRTSGGGRRVERSVEHGRKDNDKARSVDDDPRGTGRAAKFSHYWQPD